MNKIKKIVKIMPAIALTILNISSMEQQKSSKNWTHNTYMGTEITPENIYQLSPKPSEKLSQDLQEFWKNSDNQALIRILNDFVPCNNIEELRAVIAKQRNFMEKAGIQNLSVSNYVFQVKDENNNLRNFVIKIAGPSNILRTRISTVLGVDPYSKKLTDFDLKTALTVQMKIYQHVSSMAHYLRLFEIAKSFKHLKIAPTYLFPTSETTSPCHDQNCIIVQELFDNNGIVEIHKLDAQEIKEILNNLPESAIKEIFLAIKHAALWNFYSNLLVNIKNKLELWFSDLEQPNNSNGKYFFFKSPKGKIQYEGNSNCGLTSGKEANETRMCDALEQFAPKHFELWNSLMKRDWQEFFDEMTKNKY